MLNRDLQDPRYMYLKAVLFLVAAIIASAGIIAKAPEFETVILLLVLVWAASRLYYFAFYVIERYIDPTFKFAGLYSVLIYLLKRKNR